jgi:hypothetical protein
MSMQETTMKIGAGLRAGRTEHPDCPKCQRAMTVKQVTPVLFATDLDDIVFGCEDCSTEVKRTIKRK